MADPRTLYCWTPIQAGETEDLVGVLNDALEQTSTSIKELNVIDVQLIHVEPTKVFDGLMVRADGVNWDPGYGRGTYVYDDINGWEPIGSRKVGFTLYTNDTISINEDMNNPSFFTGLTPIRTNGVDLYNSLDGSVINNSGRTIAWLEGTINFQPNKVSNGGISIIKLISERSIDGVNWYGNLNSLRSIEIPANGESFRTVISALDDWLPGEILRFRCYNSTNSDLLFEAPSDVILGETYTGPSLLWSLEEK